MRVGTRLSRPTKAKKNLKKVTTGHHVVGSVGSLNKKAKGSSVKRYTH